MDVAAALLARLGPMTAVKLQKLTYYVQATQLRRTGEVVFDDDFQAWKDGPVVRSLYNRYSGRFFVSGADIGGDASAADRQLAGVLDLVAQRYGSLGAEELSDITHREDPWRLTRDGVPAGRNSERTIDLDLMRRFYTAQTALGRVDLALANARLEGAQFGDAEQTVLREYSDGTIDRQHAVARWSGPSAERRRRPRGRSVPRLRHGDPRQPVWMYDGLGT